MFLICKFVYSLINDELNKNFFFDQNRLENK